VFGHTANGSRRRQVSGTPECQDSPALPARTRTSDWRWQRADSGRAGGDKENLGVIGDPEGPTRAETGLDSWSWCPGPGPPALAGWRWESPPRNRHSTIDRPPP